MTKLSEKLTIINKRNKISLEYKGMEAFAVLFKKFRLRSEFQTLSDFADALAEEGFIYEDSIFSHWQKGDRIPKERRLLLGMLNIFIKRGGISTIGEANSFLASTGQRDLDKQELRPFTKNLSGFAPFTAPAEPDFFIGREKYLKEVSWQLLNNKPVLIYGEAGIGKTYLAIKIAHALKDKFRDGILWYRFDIRGVNNILSDIARDFGEDVSRIKDIKIKFQIVIDLISKRKLLLIFDNVDSFDQIDSFLPSKKIDYSLLLTSKHLYDSAGQIKPGRRLRLIRYIKLIGLSEKEFFDLAKKLLGLPFVLTNLEKIERLGKLIEYSPLATTILLRRIEVAPRELDKFLHHFEKKITEIYKVSYDNKTLNESLNLSFNTLSKAEQNIFASLGVYQGTDFSKEAVSYINKLSLKEASMRLLNLQKSSFVEHSAQERYRLHPLIKLFAQNKMKKITLYNELALYHKKSLSQFERGTTASYDFIEKEIDNIIGAFEDCYHFRFYQRVVELWKFIGVFLWDRGRWKNMRNYEKLIVDACKKSNDKRALALCYVREFSWLYFWQGDIKKAEEYGNWGLSLASQMNDSYSVALAKQRLGMVYQKQNRLQEAQTYLKDALKIFQKLDKKLNIGDTFLYLGHVSRKKGNLKEAEINYLKSYFRLKNNKDHEGSAIALYYLGEINLEKKRLNKAEKFFDQALQIDRLKNRRAGVAWCTFGLGEVNFLRRKVEEAKKLFQQAKKLFVYLGMDYQAKIIDKKLTNLKKLILLPSIL